MARIEIRLQAILERKGISARNLAARTGIRHPTISAMCNNTIKHLPLNHIAIICEELDISVSDMLVLIHE